MISFNCHTGEFKFQFSDPKAMKEQSEVQSVTETTTASVASTECPAFSLTSAEFVPPHILKPNAEESKQNQISV